MESGVSFAHRRIKMDREGGEREGRIREEELEEEDPEQAEVTEDVQG